MWRNIFILVMDDGEKRRFISLVKRVQGERSQRQFASDLGVSLGAVQSWLKGRIPSSKNLEKIATAANLTIEELFNEIRGEKAQAQSKKAEDVLFVALQLDERQQRRLIKLLVNRVL